MYAQYRKDTPESSKLPKLKLVYFNLRGRGETIRYILAAGGIPYEDERIDFSQWKDLKPNTLFGSLPQLEANGVRIGQSPAIQRYVAQLAGLVGQDADEQAFIDSLGDCITDIREGTLKAVFLPEGEKEPALKKLKEETVPDLLNTIETLKSQRGGKFLSGDQVSWADLHFAATWESVGGILEVKLPESLQQNYDDVRALPNVARHIKERPETNM